MLFATALAVLWTGSVMAECPSIGPAPRLPTSAEAYAKYPRHSIAANGVLQFDYGASYNNLGNHHDPYFVSIYALALYKDWLGGACTDQPLLDKFLIQTNWLADNAEMRGDLAVWSHPFANDHYHLEPGWISGIGQSRIASALYRAAAVTGDYRFTSIADAAMLTYLRPITEGGVVTVEEDVLWIEEAPDPNGTSYKVLNGHLTALSGVLDVLQITGDPRWGDVFEAGVAAVRRDVEKFDAGFTSAYSLASPTDDRPVAARKDYNVLHVSQLLWLYDTTEDPLFLKWASVFQAYEENKDTYTAERSILEDTHGPAEAAALYYNHYWSTSTFPTWFRISMPAAEPITEVIVDGYTQESSPASFDLSVTLGEEVVYETSVSGNTTKNIDVQFPEAINADAVTFTFKETISDQVLALYAAMVVRQKHHYAPVSSECNYRPDSAQTPMRYNVDLAFDAVPETKMKVYCAGHITFPLPTDISSIKLVGEHSGEAVVRYRTSADLITWTPPTEVPAAADWKVPQGAHFAMLEHETDIKQISEIRLGKGWQFPWPLDFLN